MKSLDEQVRHYFDQMADGMPMPLQRRAAPRHPRRRLAAIGAVALLGVVGLVAAVVVARDDSTSLTTVQPDSTTSTTRRGSIPLSGEQAGSHLIAATPESLWLAGGASADGKRTSVYRFDLSGRKDDATLVLPGQATSIAAGLGSIWVFTIGSDGAPPDSSTALVRIDSATSQVVATLPFQLSGQVAVNGDDVFVVSGGVLYEVDATTNQIGRQVNVGTGVFAATDGTSIWVTSPYDGRVAIVDKSSFSVRYVDTDRILGPLVAAPGTAWIIDQQASSLVRVTADGAITEHATDGKVDALVTIGDRIAFAVNTSVISMALDGRGGTTTLATGGEWDALGYEPQAGELYGVRTAPAELRQIRHS